MIDPIEELKKHLQEKNELMVSAAALLEFGKGFSGTLDKAIEDWMNKYEKHIKQR